MDQMTENVLEKTEKLCSEAPRIHSQGAVKQILLDWIQKSGHTASVQKFPVELPVFETGLVVDGETVKCLPGSLVPGKIASPDIVDSTGTETVEGPALAYNPYCNGISKPTFYGEPSLAVSATDAEMAKDAETVSGYISVGWADTSSANILVGNPESPSTIILTHYDSWWGGCVRQRFQRIHPCRTPS